MSDASTARPLGHTVRPSLLPTLEILAEVCQASLCPAGTENVEYGVHIVDAQWVGAARLDVVLRQEPVPCFVLGPPEPQAPANVEDAWGPVTLHPRRGPWIAELVATLGWAVQSSPLAAALLSSDPAQALASLAHTEDAHDGRLYWALSGLTTPARYFAMVEGAPRPSLHVARFEAATFKMAEALGAAGNPILAGLAEQAGAAGRQIPLAAVELLAHRLSPIELLGVFGPLTRSSDAVLAIAAAHAWLRGAASASNSQALEDLVDADVEPATRNQALEVLARRFPKKATPVAARLCAEVGPVAQAAAQVMVRLDGMDLEAGIETIRASADQPKEATRLIAEFAARHPTEEAAQHLLHLSPKLPPAVETQAVLHAWLIAPTRIESLRRLEGQGGALASLQAALQPGRASALLVLAGHAEQPNIQASALEAAGLRLPTKVALEVVAASIGHPDLAVVQGALRGALHLGQIGGALIHSALRSSISEASRLACLEASLHLSDETLLEQCLRRAAKDPAAIVRRRAVQAAAARRLGDGQTLRDTLVDAQDIEAELGLVDGAKEAGVVALGLVSATVLDERLAWATRRSAWRLLSVEFVAEAKVLWPKLTTETQAQLAVEERSEVQSAQDVAPSVAVAWDTSGPTHPAVPATRSSDPLDVADTRPVSPASSVVDEPSIDVVAKATPAPAEPPREPEGELGVERATAALEHALRLGKNGFRGLRALAVTDRVPTAVRVQAIRHLLTDHSHRRLTKITRFLLCDPDDRVAEAALLGVTSTQDVPIEEVARLADNPVRPRALRLRGLQLLAGRSNPRKIRTRLFQSLSSRDSAIAAAARGAVFRSLRGLPLPEVELRLVNLLKEHEAPEVQAAAIAALAAFDTKRARQEVEQAAQAWTDSLVRQVARTVMKS